MKKPAEAQPSRRPIQSDVARAAGVSRGTVSYVVNGVTTGKVSISEETRARVWRAVEELGYEPDAGARALRSGTTHTIGLVIPDLSNPHYWENAVGIEHEARAAGYRLLLSSMELNADYGVDIFKDLAGRRIDALILTGALTEKSGEAQKIMARCIKRGQVIVEIGDHQLGKQRVDFVVSDYRATTAEAMAHLLALGHKRIGFVFGLTDPAQGADRIEPYHEAIAAAGLPADPALVAECGPALEDGYQAALRLLQMPDRPTAIMALNDMMAIGVLRAAGDCGLRVPDDLSLVGCDDIPVASYLVPRLTTSSKDSVLLGRHAVRLVLDRLQNPGRPVRSIHIPARFIVRESTGPAPHAAALRM
jgi:LacI family transcriptional regulator